MVNIPLTKDEVNTLETLRKKMEDGSEDATEYLVRSVELRKLGEQYESHTDSLNRHAAKF